MPLQLIHTSAPHLLDSNSAGYGTVARSENMPRVLCASLTALSVMRDPRGGAATTGPQFSYNIIDHAGAAWHVLTCTQCAGADYSGRICHIAHHLILSQDEVRQMLASSLRPTPAGVALALQNIGFWEQKWTGEPRYITEAPELSPEDLPDATAQPTWKKLTGHKSNARAFFTSPFERDCLITIAPGTPSSDILALFHESDWLTHTRGWGVTYTTEADDADSYANTLRMVCTPNSPLVQRAVRTGHPVLNIEQGMELPLPAPATEPPVSAPLPPTPTSIPGGDIVRALSRSVSHYHYTEEPDWLLYDVKPARPKLIPGIAAGIILVGLALGVGYLYTPSGEIPQNDIAGDEVQSIRPDNVQMLAGLLRCEYNHAATVELLSKLCAISENCPEDALLLEAAMLLQAASQSGTRHASSVKRLCECARLLGLKDTDMARLYLREATSQITPEEWKQQFDGQQITDWITLKQSEPQVIELLKSDELRAYAPSDKAPEATVLATADTAPAEIPEEEESTPQPGRVSLIPTTAVSGALLPEALENIIPNLPLSISTGSYVVSRFSEGGELRPARRLDLSENGFRLYITPTERAGEFLLQPEHTEGQPSPLPPSRITIRNGRIQSIRSEDREAVVCFPVPTKENFHTNVILASSFAIPLPQGKGIKLPAAADANLNISPDNLEITHSAERSRVPKLRIRTTDSFPWVLTRSETERLRFSIKLPVLTGHNSMQQTGRTLKTYTWENAEISRETDDLSTFLCEVVHRPDLSGRLERAFDKMANTPCCGEYKTQNKATTLGHLYYICCALANEKLTRREKRELHKAYFSLFADKQFNKVLMKLLEQDTMLQLSPWEASANHFKAIQIRQNITKLLDDRAIRDRIRKRICDTLTRAMYAAYTKEQQELDAKQSESPIFVLDSIDIGSHVELMWQFRMELQDK